MLSRISGIRKKRRQELPRCVPSEERKGPRCHDAICLEAGVNAGERLCRWITSTKIAVLSLALYHREARLRGLPLLRGEGRKVV
jgi:hypothetical protein